MAAPGGLTGTAMYQQHHRASVSSPSGAPAAPPGPTGDTAQTGGFVEPSGFASSTGGGLASSPNVPAPGTTINPATGKPHTAGLTRAELQAMRAKGADLLDPAPQTEAVRRGSHPSPPTSTSAQFGVLGGVAGGGSPEQRRLSEMSGREQAARQLTATAPGTTVPQVPAPGTAPGAPTSIYEDVTTTLDKVGRTAYSVLPSSVKEVLSSNPHPPSEQRRISNASDLSASPTSGPRRNSVMMFFDKVKTDGEKIAKEIQTNLSTVDRRPSEIKQGERTAGVIGSEGGLLTQMKNMWNDVSSNPTGTGSTAVTSATSLPSSEIAGAKPGDHSSGAGALPGSITEKGVAVLPDEKTAEGASSSGTSTAKPTLPTQENQGMLPGEISAGAGALPGPSSEAGVAVPPEVREKEGSAGGLVAAAAVGAAGAAAGTAAFASNHGSSYGLAPALPQTHIGDGAANGATDLSNTPGGSSVPSGTNTLAPQTRHANDRTTSMASITAIHQGTEGTRNSDDFNQHSSPLAAAPVTASDISGESSAPAASAAGETHTPSAAPTSAETHSATAAAATGAAAAAAGTAGAVAATSHGDKTHTPASAPITEETHVSKKNPIIGDNAQSASGTPSSTLTKSLTPGEEHKSVGHPSTRDQDGTSREPGSYPKADYESKAHHQTETLKSTEHQTKPVAVATGAAATGAAATAGAAAGTNGRSSMDTAVSDAHANGHNEKGHRRKSSSASSGGKKKVGFMSKLKGEMKVLGGKLTHDDEKVQEGERLKHGE